MKAPTLKTKKSILDKKTNIADEVITDEVVDVNKKAKYILTAEMNSGLFFAEGEGMDVFSKIEKPPKYTTKGIFTLKNRETGKSFEIVYPPYLTRKLLINPFVQTVQWKRMSAKVD